MPLLPAPLRRLTPDGVRDNPALRGVAVGLGVIPPRFMHGDGEIALLTRLAAEADLVVEIGVYEGGSAVHLVQHMKRGSTLVLIDPFGEQPGALRAGWAATEWATKRVVERAARGRGVEVVWHVAYSQPVGEAWNGRPVDLIFVDGDHLEAGVRGDWDAWHGHVRPGGHVVFHDSLDGRPGGLGLPGPTKVVDELFRSGSPVAGWTVVDEVDRSTAVQRA